MSDGALSQEEIDSLLAGLDGGAGPAAASSPPPRGGPSLLSAQEAQAFKAILDATLGAQSQNLSMITGLPVNLQSPAIDATNREGILRELPEEVLAVTVPFAGSLPGDHCFIFSKELALKIASLANKDEGLTDLDDMAISAVQECVSTLTGTQITVISEKTGNRNVQSSVAEGVFNPKAMARLPAGDIVRANYMLSIGDEKAVRLTELFALSFVKDVIASSGGGQQQPSMGGGRQAQDSGYGGAMGGMGGMGGGMQGYSGGQQQMGGGMQGFGGGQQQLGGMGMGGGMQGYGMQGGPMGGYQGNPPNVQPVQFASLQMQQSAPEAGNIGLIMDVFMEMTVELGRTKKAIKEILGMGEGTIIELDKLAGEPVDILVNHKLIAKGEVVVIDESFGVRVTEIVSPMERMADLG
jgi:flagellar motor switch protein FliN/FliY